MQANPKNAEARYLLGEINLRVGDLAAAEKEFRRALDMGWSEEDALIGKIRAMLPQEKYKEVLKSANASADWSTTGRANLLALRARAYAGEGDLLKAQESILSAAKLDANAYDVLKTTLFLQLLEKQKKAAAVTASKALGLFPEDTDLMLLNASLAMLNGQNEKALQVFEQVIATSPENFVTLNVKRAYLGALRLAVLKKDFELVRKIRNEFATRNINDPEANYYFALAAFEEKDLDQAEEYLQKILKVSSGHAQTLLLSGTVSYAKREFEKAAYYLSKYVGNHPENIEARKLLGRAYMALGQSEEAKTEFNTALNDRADDAELVALVGLSEISGGKVESGLTELEKAQALAPESQPLKLQLAKVYIADGQTAKAIEQLDELLQTDGNNKQARSLKVLAYLRSGDVQMAMNTARQMQAKSPDDPDVLSMMGSIQVVARNMTAARMYFNRALRLDATHVASEMSLARLDEQQGDYASAEKHYLSLLDRNPDSMAVMISLARLAEKQGDSAGQVKWLEAARQADSKGLFPRVALMEIYLKGEQIADAEVLLKELEEIDARNPAVLAVKSRLLMAKKRFIQAEAVISELIDAMPDTDIGYYLHTQNLLAMGDQKAALDSIRKAYSIKPDALRNAVLLAQLEQSAGNYDRVVRLADDIIKIVPDSAVGHVLKGDALLAAGKPRQALTEFDRAWANTKSRDIALRRFKVTQKLSGIEAAAPILIRWLEEQPDDAAVMQELATGYFTANQKKKAVIYYEKALAQDPDNVVALNNLAWVYGLENNPRALELAEKAYSLQSGSPGISDTYGWMLLKNNKTAEALPILKRAADRLPDVPEVQYHYARALFLSGDKTAARKILAPLVRSGKAFDGRTDAEKMLTQ